MNISEIFQFDESREFPYYKENPKIKKSQWLILLLSIPISMGCYARLSSVSEILAALVFCLVMLIPILYFSNWDYNLLFYKPTKNEIILAVILFICYMIYSFTVGGLLESLGLSGTGRTDVIINISTTIGLLFAMMAEELAKFIILMFFMRIFYKFINKTNKSFLLASIITVIVFAFMHYVPGTTIASILVLQGLGSIFEFYGYFKTKNVLVPYLCHLFTDMSIFLMVLTGLVH